MKEELFKEVNYYNEIKNKLIDNVIYSKVKDRSKESYKVVTYFEIGKLLNEAGGKYGDNIVDRYSKRLIQEVGKQYNKRTLFRMKQFYNVFSNEKVSTLWTQLTWSHIRLLFNLDSNSINYYIQVIINQNISVRELEYRLKTNEFERLSKNIKNKLITKGRSQVMDYVKNPIMIKNKSNYEIISEKILKKLILEDIEAFMKELGGSFCFVGSEYKIRIGTMFNYIDLLLFNYEYNCFVVIELKVVKLKKEHIGQIEVYMNYIDENLRKYNHDKIIGIIICKQDDKCVIEYCSDKRIISREYELVLVK